MWNPFKKKKDFIHIIKSEDSFYVSSKCPGYNDVTTGLADLLTRAGQNILPLKDAIAIANIRLRDVQVGEITNIDENGKS